VLSVIGRKLLVLRVLSVLSVAVVAGHLVQSMRHTPVGPFVETASIPDQIAESLPTLTGLTAIAASSSGGDPACALRLDLAVAPDAIIDLTLSAPCNLGERVVIRHSGLEFTGSIGADGRLIAQVPAMEPDALVAAYVGGSEIVLGKIAVPDVSEFLRVGVHLPAFARFDMRAEEAGQVYVASNHSSGDDPHRIIWLGQGKTEEPLVSQVYSVALRDFGRPELTVELRITPETCGRTLAAEIVTSRSGKVAQTTRDVAVPLCGTAGDILLLKNLLPDLTLVTPE
jgi:hypothetical protein